MGYCACGRLININSTHECSECGRLRLKEQNRTLRARVEKLERDMRLILEDAMCGIAGPAKERMMFLELIRDKAEGAIGT